LWLQWQRRSKKRLQVIKQGLITMVNQLNIVSLREQVYEYLRKQMSLGIMVPGSVINIGEIAQQLGISKTPLRDALIHLEVEGFVSILPRRGVVVNTLGMEDVSEVVKSVVRIRGIT